VCRCLSGEGRTWSARGKEDAGEWCWREWDRKEATSVFERQEGLFIFFQEEESEEEWIYGSRCGG
jgi:hypothetical protein